MVEEIKNVDEFVDVKTIIGTEEEDINIDSILSEGSAEFSIEHVMSDLENSTNIDDDVFSPQDSSVNGVKKRKRAKKPQNEIDQEMVNEFLNNPTHDNFNKLWVRFYYGVKSYAFKFMHNAEMADEIACVTFTRGWEYKDMYDPTKSNFSTWLYTICKNLCLAELYKIKKDNYVPQDISEIYDSEKLSNNICTTEDNTQYTVEDNTIITNSPDEITTKIYNTSIMEIKNLGGTYTKILTMKLIDDMKIREISEELDMNESTVKNYLYKGKEMLNDILKTKHHTLYEMYIDSCTANDQQSA